MKKILLTTLLAVVVSSGSSNHWLTAASASSFMAKGDPAANSPTLYTAYTLWYDKPKKMSSINYHSGAIIPAGTAVVSVTRHGKTIKFKLAGEGGAFSMQFIPKFHPGVSVEAFTKRLFVPEPLEERIKQFSEEEKALIRKGAVEDGMSKEAVLISWGPPPEHQTPSTTASSWIYWRNRFMKQAVDFDQNGKVVNTR